MTDEELKKGIAKLRQRLQMSLIGSKYFDAQMFELIKQHDADREKCTCTCNACFYNHHEECLGGCEPVNGG